MATLPAIPPPGPALREYAEGELADAMAALAGPRERDRHEHDGPGRDAPDRIHEGIHRARKAIRRTRAALSLADAVLGPGARLIDGALRRLNKRSSGQRDAHALVQTLDRLRQRRQPQDTRAPWSDAHRIAVARRDALARDPTFGEVVDDTRAQIAVLRAGLSGLPWETLEARDVVAALEAAARKAAKAGARARRSDDDEDWHAWRRRMRRRSQQFRAAGAVGIDAALSPHEKSVIDQLGRLQDLALVIAHCRAGGGFDDTLRKALRGDARRALARQRKRIRSVGRLSPPLA